MLNELRSIARRCTITRTHDRFADQAREHIAVIDAIEERDAPGRRCHGGAFRQCQEPFSRLAFPTMRQMAQDNPGSMTTVHEYKGFQGCEAAFPAAEFAERQKRARAAIDKAGFDALVVTSPENIYWLTGRQTAGYFAFQAFIMPTSGPPVLLVRQLEMPGAVANTWLDDIVSYQDGEDPAEVLSRVLRGLGASRLAMELDGWFVSPRFAADIAKKAGFAAIEDGSAVLPPLRIIKSSAELQAIRTAAKYAEKGLMAGLSCCSLGSDENAVAAAMLEAATLAGSETMAMEPWFPPAIAADFHT